MFDKVYSKSRRIACALMAVGITAVSTMADAHGVFLGPENSGAENGFAGWYNGVLGGGSVSIENDDPASGNNYFRIGITNAEAFKINHADLRSQKFPLAPDGKARGPFTLSFAYKLPGEVKPRDVIDVNFRFFDQQGRYVGQKTYHVGSTTHDSEMTQYKTMTMTKIPAPRKAVQADIWIVANIFTHWTSGYAQFDDFSVTDNSMQATAGAFFGDLFGSGTSGQAQKDGTAATAVPARSRAGIRAAIGIFAPLAALLLWTFYTRRRRKIL